MLASLHWGAGLSLEGLVCVLAVRRNLFRRLPLFTAYLVLLVLSEVIRAIPLRLFGLASPQYFWSYWTTDAGLLAARGAVIAEILFRVLGPYRGVWRLCQGLLIALGAILICAAAVTSRASDWYAPYLILSIDRGLELSIVGVLLFALLFCRHYGVKVDRMIGRIALGLSFYSLVQVANNTAFRESVSNLYPWWAQVRVISFEVLLIIWILTLWKPFPSAQPAPQLLEPGVYALVSSQVSARLRELNARLEEMLHF
ncbi:MAG: hypothetical protein WAR24_18235 [Candidatus Acidiferrales bacterium]